MRLAVKPEFRPTLPDLVGPRWRRLSRTARIVVVGVLAAFAGAILGAIVVGGHEDDPLVVRGPVAFNLIYDRRQLERTTPAPGDALLLRTKAGDPDPESFAVRPITIPAYRGDASGALPIVAARLIDEMRAADSSFVLRSEGRARINRQPGYQIQWQAERGGRTTYGRRTLLFPDEPGAREGADITILGARSGRLAKVDDVGSNGPTKLPYRSFRLGTERP